jgi:AcrR family transcriptional regulator
MMSVTVVAYDCPMSRWEPGARERLAEAALNLYSEHGYDQTTVAEIAKRAGLTERTFFRHFADKPEVLFYGGQHLNEVFLEAIAAAPADATPLAVVESAVRATHELFDGRHAYARKRQAIIDAHPELRERELIKLATIAASSTAALRVRGVPEPVASLVAEAGMAVFKVAFTRWVEDETERDLAAVIDEMFVVLRSLVTDA